MSNVAPSNRLDRPIDEARDHILGRSDAEISLVEYGSYACSNCRAANEAIAGVRGQLGDRVRYVFRHRPLTGSDIARRAAELVERADSAEQFWDAHIKLMTRSENLSEDDLRVVADDLGLRQDSDPVGAQAIHRAKARVEADERSARASGVLFTPTFFINGRRYDGPWDESSLTEALRGTLGHRVQSAALDFASWGPSAGILLLVATAVSFALTNSPVAPTINRFWDISFGLTLESFDFRLSLRHWINDGLLTFFFLVVGLEIKREFTVGHLAGWRSAAMPVAGAIGGMIVPAALYLLILPSGAWSAGWGIPMSTDTAFAIAIIVMLGRLVPIELRIFLTAAAIVDDIGAILTVAVFYSGELQIVYLVCACAIVGTLAMLSRSGVYHLLPYMVLGVALWACILASGLHPTLAGVLLAVFIPTRPPANLKVLMAQADSIIAAEAEHEGEALRRGPSAPTLRALDAIHDRLESPADRLLRSAGSRSSYVVLPLFAFANAGVNLTTDTLNGYGPLTLALILGLAVGKPLGFALASGLAVMFGFAVKPKGYSWLQLCGAGALAGIGFTMSLFIASQAFPDVADFEAAKITVLIASLLSAVIGVALLWIAGLAPRKDNKPTRHARLSFTSQAPGV
jgi:Na+:H+ antiporter, NhaA family